MKFSAQGYISTRDLMHDFSKIKGKDGVFIVMNGSKPSNILLPFDEGILELLRPFIKKTASQIQAEKALQEYQKGNTDPLSNATEKYYQNMPEDEAGLTDLAVDDGIN